ncbi:MULTISPECIES: LysR family transcriptional regulator [Mycolicibacterium]|uniref:LysR family transcriptional regulator n=1 Tax=Mycolicibacterium TaxID=1866885 RepID=UPI000684AD6D|nr:MULTISPECIES: LysR family transcriptional regulator [Mycolicibacterium]QZY45095.1 LysR family transcriptional regulator [Mycolicibacterium austroafricanum]UJL28843.1 LysR family transcriptional regulator [Mycolicibacterium vanbaalenii]WND55555.1 LysR family transcriptional regulator [Mycolicibacterium vanbaalenii]
MELRQLEAFVAVAGELHFGRAAEKLHIGQPTLSELIRRLEREVGTPLLTRTTRRVALTQAGVELFGRAKVILDDVEGAAAAVRRLADGEAGTVRLGITPPVAPVLAPHLSQALHSAAPDVQLVVQRMWLPDLQRAIGDGELDVAITCGPVADPPGILSEVFCAEPVMVGLRADHHLAGRDAVELRNLSTETIGVHSEALFPAWSLALRQVLDDTGIRPPAVEFTDTDLAAYRWPIQSEVDWVLTTAAVAGDSAGVVLRPTSPAHFVPYTLQWCPIRATTLAVGRFVRLALSVDVPPGWVSQPDHLRHGAGSLLED